MDDFAVSSLRARTAIISTMIFSAGVECVVVGLLANVVNVEAGDFR